MHVCVCVSLSEVSVSMCVCVHDRRWRSGSGTGITHLNKDSRASDPDSDRETVTERQFARRQTVTVSIVRHYWCLKWIVFCNRQYIEPKGLYYFLKSICSKSVFWLAWSNAASRVGAIYKYSSSTTAATMSRSEEAVRVWYSKQKKKNPTFFSTGEAGAGSTEIPVVNTICTGCRLHCVFILYLLILCSSCNFSPCSKRT